MDIYIPTLGRAKLDQQHTLRQLLAAGIKPTLVVQPHEFLDALELTPDCPVLCLPAQVKGIAPTRDHILHDVAGSRKVLMLDDDLHFAVRRQDDPTKFRQPEPEDIRAMVAALDAALDNSAHVSIGAREGGNRNTAALLWNTRMMRVLAYRRDVLKRECITFAPMEVMEDFHVTLQLLRAGYDCVVENRWVSNQAGGSAAPGGCSTFRTAELHAKNAELLAQKHPTFVRVVEKQTKGAWGGGTRIDVQVQWKKARSSAQQESRV
jgi:hypothetical protein